MMLVLLSLMTAVVVFRSPYAPVVGGPVDIEVLWEIEDTRVESEEPLVTAMENYGTPLAYDRENNTFYCTLGMENDETWPPLHLTVSNAGGEQMFSFRMIILMTGAMRRLRKDIRMS